MKFRCKATGMSFDGCHTTNSLKRIKAMFQCCDTQECHCTVLHHGCSFLLGIYFDLENKWLQKKGRSWGCVLCQLEKKTFGSHWIHAVRKSMRHGDEYPSNTHTKKNGPAWPQDSLSGTNLWLGVETAHGAVTCLCLDQNDRNQISYIGILGGETGPDTFLECTWCSMMFLAANLYELWYLNMTWSEPIRSKVA